MAVPPSRPRNLSASGRVWRLAGTVVALIALVIGAGTAHAYSAPCHITSTRWGDEITGPDGSSHQPVYFLVENPDSTVRNARAVSPLVTLHVDLIRQLHPEIRTVDEWEVYPLGQYSPTERVVFFPKSVLLALSLELGFLNQFWQVPYFNKPITELISPGSLITLNCEYQPAPFVPRPVPTPIPPLQPIEIDQTSGRFQKGGTPAYLHTATGIGIGNSLLWTCSNGNQEDNWGKWTPDIPRTNPYRVRVFVPRDYADTTSARYRIRHRDGETEVTLDQSRYFDEWRDLGVFWFTQGADGYVRLSDRTGVSASCKLRVAFDAVRFEPLGIGGPEPAPGAPTIQSPYESQTFVEGETVHVVVADDGAETRLVVEGGPDGALVVDWQRSREIDLPGLWAGRSYSLTAQSRTGSGEGPVSARRTFHIRPAAPEALTVQSGLCGRVLITWSPRSGVADTHRILRDGRPLTDVSAAASAFEDLGVQPGHRRTYAVRAVLEGSESNASNTVATDVGVCPTPTPTPSPTSTPTSTSTPSETGSPTPSMLTPTATPTESLPATPESVGVSQTATPATLPTAANPAPLAPPPAFPFVPPAPVGGGAPPAVAATATPSPTRTASAIEPSLASATALPSAAPSTPVGADEPSVIDAVPLGVLPPGIPPPDVSRGGTSQLVPASSGGAHREARVVAGPSAPFPAEVLVTRPEQGYPNGIGVTLHLQTAEESEVPLPPGVTVAKVAQIRLFNPHTGALRHTHPEPLLVTLGFSPAERELCWRDPRLLAIFHDDGSGVVTRLMATADCDAGTITARVSETSGIGLAVLDRWTAFPFRIRVLVVNR